MHLPMQKPVRGSQEKYYRTYSFSSWWKGKIENSNEIIRQYISKGTDFSNVTNKRNATIQAKINRKQRDN